MHCYALYVLDGPAGVGMEFTAKVPTLDTSAPEGDCFRADQDSKGERMFIACHVSGTRPAPRLALGLAIFTSVILGPRILAEPLPAAEPESVGMSSERLARIEPFVQREIDQGNVAGVVVAVARQGRLVHYRAYGYADLEGGIHMETDHLFRLYSMTKPVASVALLTLYEHGLFQLIDPLDLHLPMFRDRPVFAGIDDAGGMILEEAERPPTIQDVFRHTAGFASGVRADPVDQLYRERGITMGQLESLSEQMEKLAELPWKHQPGEQWVYGLEHDVQAYLVEHFSGMSYDVYLREAIFEPLRMHDTFFGVPDELQQRFARVHQPAQDGEGLVVPSGDAYARYVTRPFGTLGLSSSAGDYVRFAQMLLNGGELDGVRILGRKTVEMLAQNHLPPHIPNIELSAPLATGYGLGFSVTLDSAALGRLGSPGTFGWSGVATTVFSVDPREELAIVLMAQKQPNDTRFLATIQNLIYQAIAD